MDEIRTPEEYKARVESFMVNHSQMKGWFELTKDEAKELERITDYKCDAKSWGTFKVFNDWSMPFGYIPWGSV
jgi:hypothetical protein